MKPREFLAEGNYPLTLALSYSFDPVFFEQMVLPALWTGGAEDVLVLADKGEIDRAFLRSQGPLRELGRRYLLAPVHRVGAFHPKMMLRLGRESGAVWVSSGNLTHGGWGLNREVAACWQFGPGLPDSGGWVRPLLRSARGWASNSLAEAMLGRMEELHWIPEPGAQSEPVMVSGDRTIAAQVEARWAGRRFSRLRFLTGSTDQEGAVLRWFHDTFGVTEAEGALTPGRCDWQAERLNELPLKVKLTAHSAPVIHAKAYHLSGPDGDVLLVGSANCSPSAWLRPGSSGNVEAMLVYEAPGPEDLEFLSEAIGDEPGHPSTVLLAGPDRPDESSSKAEPVLQIRSFQIREDGSVALDLIGTTGGWDVELVLDDERVALRQEGDLWVGRAPENLPPGLTAFGHVEAQDPRINRSLTSPRRWADDLRHLNESKGARRLGRKLEDLTKPGSKKDDDQLVRELGRLAHDLIRAPNSLADPFIPRREETKVQVKAPPLDPGVLIRSLKSLEFPVQGIGAAGHRSLSLSGIYRAFYSGAEGEGEAEGVEVSLEEQAEGSMDDGAPEVDMAQPAMESSVPEDVEDKVREKFEKHLEAFIEGLGTPAFRAQCTATTLSQALAYPFAAVTLGLERRWADPDRAREWVAAAAGELLRPRSKDEPVLLEAVRDRYEADGSLDIFHRLLGDGKLWVAMVVGMSETSWKGDRQALERLLFLRDLWETEDLRIHADPERIDGLLRRCRAPGAVERVRSFAAPGTLALNTLEARLGELWETAELGSLWTEVRVAVDSNELLWGPGAGWVLTLEAETDGKVTVFYFREGKETKMRLDGYFVSVPQIMKYDDVIEKAWGELRTILDMDRPGLGQEAIREGEAA